MRLRFACPSSGAVRTIESIHAPEPSIGAHGITHRPVLADGSLGQLLTTGQHIRHFLVGHGHHFSDGFLVERIRPDSFVGELYIPAREHHPHGVLAPPCRSFSTTYTEQSTTPYNEDGTRKRDYLHQEGVEWSTTAAF